MATDPGRPGVEALLRAREEGRLVVVGEGDPGAYPQLDAGEATVLSAAATAGAAVILDERKARALLELDPNLTGAIRLATGIVGLILLAKRRGRIPAVRTLLDALRRQSFWIGQSFYERILQEVSSRRPESPDIRAGVEEDETHFTEARPVSGAMRISGG